MNIVLKRDYSGFDVQAAYGNTFREDFDSTNVSATAGFSLEEGRTRVLVAASHSRADALQVADRSFGDGDGRTVPAT